MNADESKQRFVSSLKLHIKPPQSSCAQRNEMMTDTWTSVKPSATGKTVFFSAFDTFLTTLFLNPDSLPKNLDPPVFIEALEDSCVDEGSDLVLRGVLTGSKPIKVTWLHNGKAAPFGKPSFNGGEVRFVVRDCLPEDAGSYSCLAENSAGGSSCRASVAVRDFESMCGVSKFPTSAAKSISENGGSPQTPKDQQRSFRATFAASPTSPDTQSPVLSPREIIPKKRSNSGTAPALQFQNPPQHVDVKVGQPASLTCFFTGSPPVASCWIRNKEQIADSLEVWTESTDQSSSLVITEAKAQHTGRYTVVVKDRRSSTQHSLTLSVIDRPEPPASPPVISLVSGSSLVLSWSGPCYDGGSVVLGYVVEVRNPGLGEPGEWKELTNQCKSTSYKVTSGLEPQQEFCFRVRAYNAAGVSEPGPVSPVVRMEQKAPAAYTCVTIDSSHKVIDHYDLHEKLGTGKFGSVYKLTHKETGCVCAGKFYKGRRAKERDAARKEIELMNYLHHPKLVQCLGAYDQKPEMVMVMEFIAGGELFERIVDDTFEHTESNSVRYMQQILEGIAYMHQQNIVHLDLKPENIVCVDTTGTSIKIIDFGLASRLDRSAPLKVLHGTPEFVAPEVINYEPVSLATDLWSIGVICYILLSGESPFQGSCESETLALVTAAQWEFDDESFQDITEEAKDFIGSLLNKDPRKRMSCEEGLAHPWMEKFASGDVTTTKSLSKEKMKKFLITQKWKKAGKAMQALKRMALLSKSDSSATLTSPGKDVRLSPEAEHALQSLEQKMQGPPQFTKSLEEQTVARGSCVRLSCHLTGQSDRDRAAILK
ncbi:myosin light chain kinase, smooth muscle [Nematolebias whitei]|uniref:myosin light chain kinase, smooth muscle n=1 Tax=Nematolebias whitei TaxID=451745 RepID=UPI0018970F43|nr:myosin light chain kinase, smooth muscle [Nematolebias whitei]